MTTVGVISRADELMDQLGDNPTKTLLDRAWRELDALWDQLEESARHLLLDDYEILVNLYATRGLNPPRGVSK